MRYADDFVCCFQYKEEAERFYILLRERLAKFELKIAEEKSKIIMFGRCAESNRKNKGLGKPDTFDFLGFTHYEGLSRYGRFVVKRKTSKKKFKAKLKAFTAWIRTQKDRLTIHQIFKIVKAKLIGHYNYYGITFNMRMMRRYYHRITKLLFKWLNRRSQRKSFEWESFQKYLELNPLPKPAITHRFKCGKLVSVR